MGMMRMKVALIIGGIVGGSIVLLVLAGVFLNFIIGAALEQTYSPFQTSVSIAEARQSQKFVSQPTIEQQMVNLDGFKYPIQEVWIEEATRVKYEWIFFRKRITTGYRLMITLTVPNDSPDEKRLIRQRVSEPLIANDQIELRGVMASARKETWFFYDDLEKPFPNKVTLAFKKVE
jgi:hypothetical protein